MTSLTFVVTRIHSPGRNTIKLSGSPDDPNSSIKPTELNRGPCGSASTRTASARLKLAFERDRFIDGLQIRQVGRDWQFYRSCPWYLEL